MPSLLQLRVIRFIEDEKKRLSPYHTSPLWERARDFALSYESVGNLTVEKTFLGLKDLLVLTFTLNSKGHPTFISVRYAPHYSIQNRSYPEKVRA